ncbi:hypothetical protein Sulku_0717 [Sulfuricurvum kujiense DSM 16994]|uniref:Uncharacterized protein n=1 Tax=Sulfuricurvum kujiense (strain ATCC BAA-921 / DSM 16994 / JCM 11577 / YK-1) TaxID=709032 RepID=E4U179_SULKY|nr:hypothetical protein [Sulfuricurvum kujiense]ADR33383.1 hypothetical protein Sulku_0717 [Sulfuricurvum kujiense DSM 16994]
MKWLVLLPLLLSVSLSADTKQKLFDLYQQGNYLKACNLGVQGLANYPDDEVYISLYAFSCLKADFIDRLAVPIIKLNQTKEARSNASYFSVILMQKKLLMQALYDNKQIKNVKFPTSSYLLSRVFDFYVKDPQPNQLIKEYRDPANARSSYKLYTSVSNGHKSIAIDEYYDKILTLHHVY